MVSPQASRPMSGLTSGGTFRAMTDADAALADYNSVGSNYGAEAGESKAHTYHWLHTFKAAGSL